MPTTTVYLIRHGRTALNAQDVLRGSLDVPLDTVGEAEATRLGELFAAVPLVVVATSPLQRARDTAAALAAATGAPVHADQRLADRDYGPWAGQPQAEVEQRFGGVDHAPDVEPLQDFRDRVCGAFDDLVAASDGPIAIVAHDAVNRMLLHRFSSGLVGAMLGQRTGCWNRLERTPERGWHASVVDGKALIVNGKHAVVYLWYDNEFGYSCQVVRTVQYISGIEYPTSATA